MNSTYKIMIGIAALAVPLVVLGGVFAHSHGFEGVLGGIGWFGFLLCVLALVVLALVALVRGVKRRAATI